MRTAEETINRIVLTGFDFPDAIQLIKEYAKQVAEQALKDAANRVKNIDYQTSQMHSDIPTILNTEIKTP